MNICLDPGHGMSNKKPLVYDPGTCFAGYEEATIALDWVNELREALRANGHTVVRTRRDAKDPCPIGRRDDIARAYGCERMLSIHCNSYNSTAHGTEVFYRGGDDKPMAEALVLACSKALGTKSRGVRTESQSQHSSLAVLDFDKCWLLELGFLDHPEDRAAILDPDKRHLACLALASVLSHP